MKKDDFTFKNNKVYDGEDELKGMVPESFEVLYSYSYYGNTGYLKDTKGIWWFNSSLKKLVKFVTSDVDNFTVIDDNFSKDSKHVYEALSTFKTIPNANPKTFQIIQDEKIPNVEVFYKDKNQCYAMSNLGEGLIIIDDANPETFGGCSWNNYAVDKDHLFNYNHTVEIENDLKYTKLDSRVADEDWDFEKTFELNKAFLMEKYPHIHGWWHPKYPNNIFLNDIVYDTEYNYKDLLEQDPQVDVKPFYHQENKMVYYCFYEQYNKKIALDTFNMVARAIPTIIRNVDLPSFKQLNEYYAKDNNHVYFKHKKILNIDVDSAEAVSEKFIRDKYNYFYDGQLIENADYNSFKTYKLDEFNDIAIDDYHFFHKKHKRISKFKGYAYFMTATVSYDKKSYVKLSDKWSKDKDNVYFEHVPFASKDVDVDTFQIIDDTGKPMPYEHLTLAVDKNNLYLCTPYNEKIMKGIDGASFTVLNAYWGKDNNVVVNFEKERIMKAIDAETFEVLDDEGKAQDKDYVYEYNLCDGVFPELKKKKRAKK